MTTALAPAGSTFDRLAEPDHRTIETTWTTGTTNHDGEVLIVVTTRHNTYRKQIETSLHTATLQRGQWIVRKMDLFGPASTDKGVIVTLEKVGRFSQAKARAQHADAITFLNSGGVPAMNAVEAELLALWDARQDR